MTASDPRTAQAGDFNVKPWSWGLILGIFCVPAIWIFASPYTGIDGDARIYMARAVADLDPDGVGRDVMFAFDGQSGFTIFRGLAAWLAGALGPSKAALGLAVLNMAVWPAALVTLASCFARGRGLALLAVCAAVLPCSYGFYPLMGSREIIAVPRPLSEAAVLFALAALCRERIYVSLSLLCLAAALHPIMALPGFGVFLIVQGRRDPRWFVAVGLGIAGIAAAAFAGLPVLARLRSVADPQWRAILDDRNPYLFVSQWHAVSFAPLTVQASTVALAALLTHGRSRALFVAILGMATAGVVSSVVFGDWLSSAFALQVQPWRSLWLVAVLAMPAFGLCLLELPKRGSMAMLALAFLSFSWATYDALPASPVAASIALALAFVPPARAPAVSPVFVPMIAAILFGLACAIKWPGFCLAFDYLRDMPAMRGDITGPLWRAGLLAWPLILLAALWTHRPGGRFEAGLASGFLGVLTVLALFTWDARPPAAKRIAANVHDATLTRLLAARPGEVLWLTSDDVWYWTGRPQWNSFTQGAGIVFSRPLALLWHQRMSRLVALGLADEGRLRPWRTAPKFVIPTLTPAAVAGLCDEPGAPAWLVAPLLSGTDEPSIPGATIWQAPVAQDVDLVENGHVVWRQVHSYAVIACSRPALADLAP